MLLCLSAKHLQMSYSTQNNHRGKFLYLIAVKAVLFAIISATTYYRFLGSKSHMMVKLAHAFLSVVPLLFTK